MGHDRTRGGLALFGMLCIGSALFAYAWSIDFLAARWLMWVAVVPAIVLGAVGARWVAGILPIGNDALRGQARSGGGRLVRLVFIVVAAWFVLVRALGGGITRLTGRTATLPPMQMVVWHVARSGWCPDRLRGEEVNQFGQGRLCVSKSQMAEYRGVLEGGFLMPPRDSVEVQLVGRQGPFGFYVTRFRNVSNTAAGK